MVVLFMKPSELLEDTVGALNSAVILGNAVADRLHDAFKEVVCTAFQPSILVVRSHQLSDALAQRLYTVLNEKATESFTRVIVCELHQSVARINALRHDSISL